MSIGGATLSDLSDEARAALAHELRAPLAMIVGYAELFRMRSDDATRSEAGARISEAAERLTETIERLLGPRGDT